MFGVYSDKFVVFNIPISYYGLIIAFGLGLGIFIACKNAKIRGLKSEDIFLACCYIIPLAIIGARIYYVLFSLDKYKTQPFWEVFKIWDGGIAIYGAVIGGALGIGLYCLIHKKNFFDLADVAVPSLILGQALGRIGCYFSGCCYGIPTTNPSLQWFPFSVQIDGVWRLSTMFYESIWNFLVFIVLILLLRKTKLKRGDISAFYLILYGIGRAVIETFRGDSLMIGSLKASQILSIILIVAGLVILLVNHVAFKKRAGGKI